MRLPPRPAGSQETSSAQSGGREPAAAPGDPLPPARAPRGRRTPGRRDVTPLPCQLRATPGPPPGHPKAIPDNPGPPYGHLQTTPIPALVHLRAISWATSGPSPGRGWGLACAAGPPPRSHPTAQGAGDARCQARAQRGGPTGSRRRAGPGAAGAAHRGSPQAGGSGARAAASDGPAQPLQWRCGGRGARVTAGGRPKPRRSPPSPPRRAAPPHPSPTSSPLLLPLRVLSGAGLRSIKIRRPRGRK